MIRLSLTFTLLFVSHLSYSQVAMGENASYSGTSFSYPCSPGSNRLLVMIIAAEFNGADNVTSVVWGTKTLTSIGSVTSGSSITNLTAAFYLKESDIASSSGTSATITCSTGGSNIRSLTCHVILLTGVLQSTPLSEVTTNTATSTTTISFPSAITSDNGDFIIAASSSNRNSITFTTSGTGFTELADANDTQHSYTIASRSISTSGTSSSPTFTGSMSSNRMTMLGFEINSSLDPLPVKLLTFDALHETNKVRLKWTTASEEETSAFIIEHSMDGQTWLPITNVAAAGYSNSQIQYSYEDFNPKSGMNYYRLKELDRDGSEIVLAHTSVRIDADVNTDGLAMETGVCHVYSLTGTLLFSGKVQAFLSCESQFASAPHLIVMSKTYPNKIYKHCFH